MTPSNGGHGTCIGPVVAPVLTSVAETALTIRHHGSILMAVCTTNDMGETDMASSTAPGLRSLDLLFRLACLGILVLVAGCKEDPAAPIADTPELVPPLPSVRRMQFPSTVGTVIDYSYWYEEGNTTWGTLTARTESRGTRTWQVTAATGDSTAGTVTLRVTGRDTVITQKDTPDMMHPGAIDTAIVTTTTTFMTTYTADTMKVDLAALFKTGQPSYGIFVRAYPQLPDSVRVGGDGYGAPYTVYQNRNGLIKYFYSHSSRMYIKSERLVFMSRH